MKEDILNKIVNILHEKLLVESKKLQPSLFDQPLTGKSFGLDAIDLIYLFFYVEEGFKIRINVKTIKDYEFNTINGICNIIQAKLEST